MGIHMYIHVHVQYSVYILLTLYIHANEKQKKIRISFSFFLLFFPSERKSWNYGTDGVCYLCFCMVNYSSKPVCKEKMEKRKKKY